VRFGFVIFNGEVRLIIQPRHENYGREPFLIRARYFRGTFCSAICDPRFPAGFFPDAPGFFFFFIFLTRADVDLFRTFDTLPNVALSLYPAIPE